MNEVIKALQTRRSIRKYKPDMIPDEIIDEIMEAGTYAATGMNRQAPIIIAIKDKVTRDKLEALNKKFFKVPFIKPFYGAPVVLVVLADKNVSTYLYDGSLVMGNLMLAAHSLGIGSCWIHRAKEEFETPEGKALLKSLGIKGDYEGIGHCILGYPDEAPQARPRKKDYIYKID
ncbi:MAG: nitroreductase [Clostridia bacterium]|nr:nitroreductase [Clostridia bacterium]